MLGSTLRTMAVVAILTVCCTCCGADLEDNWNDLLHYTKIGRLDLARGFAQSLLASDPDAVKLLELAEENPAGTMILQMAAESNADAKLAELAARVLATIEKGRFIRRREPSVIVDEIQRLSGTARGRLAAMQRIQNAGEYAVPYMIDAISDNSRREELPNIVWALPRIGRPAIRPLAAAMQTSNVAVKAEIIKALGDIRYPQALAYLKYAAQTEKSDQLVQLAEEAIGKIDPATIKLPAWQLFYNMAEDYYYHAESLAPASDASLANIWFWNDEKHMPIAEPVEKSYFHELMAMRCCEWSLKADPAAGQAIGLWIAAFFKAEKAGIEMPKYFGANHADAATYASTTGPEYLHHALARAVRDNDAHVALGVIEAMIKSAGEKSLFYRLGTGQPLLDALSFNDKAVRYSSAIAVAEAGPRQGFAESSLVVATLAEAIRPSDEAEGVMDGPTADEYAMRAARAMLKFVRSRNPVLDAGAAMGTLVEASRSPRPEMQVLAVEILAYIDSPDAQRAIAAAALDQSNAQETRISAFNSMALSAKLNGALLDDIKTNKIYSLVGSDTTEPDLRSAAAAAYGALNLPSRKVKDLILDQSRS